MPDIKILTTVISSNENYSPCSYALITLTTDKLARVFEQRSQAIELKKKYLDLYSLSFWDAEPIWIASEEIDDHSDSEVLERLDEEVEISDFRLFATKQELKQFATLFPEGFVEMSSDCATLVVNEVRFYWECLDKHSNVRLQTQTFGFDKFENFLRKGALKKVKNLVDDKVKSR